MSHGDSPFFFTWGGGSPLLGEKRAFLAEPSARPAINGRLDEEWGMNKMRKKKKKQQKKKMGEKELILCFPQGQKISARSGEVVVMRRMVESGWLQ